MSNGKIVFGRSANWTLSPIFSFLASTTDLMMYRFTFAYCRSESNQTRYALWVCARSQSQAKR